MRRIGSVFFVLGLLVAVTAGCGKKGLPEECDAYLARYDCYLAKMGMTDRATTVEGMRTTWTDASKTSTGRSTVQTACVTSEASMTAKFAEAGCANAKPKAR